MPGEYNVTLEADDSQEKYPLKMNFIINDRGVLEKGEIIYPTYQCKSKIEQQNKVSNKIGFTEKMIPGYDICANSTYELSVIKDNFFLPHLSDYLSFKLLEEDNKVTIKTLKYQYKPSSIARLRIDNKVANFEELLMLTDSSVIQNFINKVNDKQLKIKAQEYFNILLIEENTEFDKIKNIRNLTLLEGYISKYPNSPHINNIKNKVATIKKENLIASYRKEGTTQSLYNAYLLSNQDKDIVSMLETIKSIEELFLFIKDKENLNTHQLVKIKKIFFYREFDTFDGYIKAYKLSDNSNDIKNFLKNIKSISQLDTLLGNEKDIQTHNLVLNKYAKMYREYNTFKGYLKAFSYTHEQQDIESAYKLAKTIEDKKEIEITLIKHFGINSVFKISGILKGNEGSGSSDFQYQKFIADFKSNEGKAILNLRVSKSDNSKVPIKYGDYKVKVKVKLALKYQTVTFGIGLTDTQYIERVIWVNLTKSNNYTDTREIDFGKVIQESSGEVFILSYSKKLVNVSPLIGFEDIVLK